MKKKRHSEILAIVRENEIETQEELQSMLKERGFDITQATISRDIKELRLLKELTISGKYKYSTGQKFKNNAHQLTGMFAQAVTNVTCAMNIVVVKCYSGMANAACAAIDAIEWDGVVGTLAGDDTIFVICLSEEYALIFASDMERLTNA